MLTSFAIWRAITPRIAEAPHHLAHVRAPGAQVALLRAVGVVAHLQLDQVAAPGEALASPR